MLRNLTTDIMCGIGQGHCAPRGELVCTAVQTPTHRY